VDTSSLSRKLVDIFTFLEAVKTKPSMWADERLEPLRDWHGYVSSHTLLLQCAYHTYRAIGPVSTM
jgi:hypothetical protein